MDVMEALQEHGDVGAQIVDLLYGDAGIEVSKALSAQQKRERTQTRVAQASNIVGLSAGAAATPGAIAAVRPAMRRAAGKPDLPANTRVARSLIGSARGGNKVVGGTLRALKTLRKPKVAAGLAVGAAGLQVANLGGDAVTNAVLSRTAKKEIKKGATDIEFAGEFSKMDTEKRQVFGWASVVTVDGVPVSDLQGDEIDLEEIEKAAYDYVLESRKGGNMHQRDGEEPLHVSDLIESMVITPEKAQALGLGEIKKTGWWVGFKVHDDETWAQRDQLVGFSIHGHGRRK